MMTHRLHKALKDDLRRFRALDSKKTSAKNKNANMSLIRSCRGILKGDKHVIKRKCR